jgi:hypothetical protein
MADRLTRRKHVLEPLRKLVYARRNRRINILSVNSKFPLVRAALTLLDKTEPVRIGLRLLMSTGLPGSAIGLIVR